MADVRVDCPREGEILEAITCGRWPSAVEPELREHAATCAICREVADIAGALRSDQIAICRGASLPPSSQVWWRAAVRARVEAQRTAARPMVMVQQIAAACAAVAACAAPIWFALRTDWRVVATEMSAAIAARAADLASAPAVASSTTLSVVLAFSLCALFAPVVLYLLLSDD